MRYAKFQSLKSASVFDVLKRFYYAVKFPLIGSGRFLHECKVQRSPKLQIYDFSTKKKTKNNNKPDNEPCGIPRKIPSNCSKRVPIFISLIS